VKLRLAVAAVLLAFVAGCGGSDEGDSSTPPASAGGGEQLFKDNCSSCHTLAAAGASGKVGPDLDQLKPGPDLVTTQVNNGGGAMPAFKGKLTSDQINQIADYVSSNAGKS
jgi:mono/diheme cytochrome c family protein